MKWYEYGGDQKAFSKSTLIKFKENEIIRCLKNKTTLTFGVINNGQFGRDLSIIF